MFIYHFLLGGESLFLTASHADETFQALADRLRARDESLIASKINANEYIDTTNTVYHMRHWQ